MKKIFVFVIALVAILASCSSPAGDSGGNENGTQPSGGTVIPEGDAAKSDTQLVKEANAALKDGDWQQAINKFRYAYTKNPIDSNKIYYALTELATLSVDDTVVDVMKNKLGVTSYPTTLNALFNTEWAKDKSQTVLGSGWTKTYPSYDTYMVFSATQSDNGSYIRVSGTRTNTYSSGTTRYISYVLDDGDWWEIWSNSVYRKNTSGNYLINVTPDANGPYIVYRDSTEDASVATECRYTVNYSHDKAVPGDPITLPELAVPSWVTSQEFYKSTLIGTTLSYNTWVYLLYANIVTNNENGLNETIDKLLSAVHKKSETIKSVVDSLGNETATLETSFIKTLNLTQLLGEDSLEISKTEMNLLVATLEGIDAVLDFAASYDLSANIKTSEANIGTKQKYRQNILKIIKNSMTAKTLANRSSEKMTASKDLFTDAFSRVISSYDSIKSSTRYPQIIKDNVEKYGDIIYDGAIKARAAIQNGSVLCIPKTLEGKTFPTDLTSSAFGIDMGKVFTAGYFTKFFERSADLATIKFYYKRIQETITFSPLSQNTSTSEPIEITDLDTFFNNIISDAGKSSNGSTFTHTCYKIGILANQAILSAALPSATNVAEKIKFIELFRIN